MAPKLIPPGQNTTGIDPDGTPAIGSPEQMRPLMEQWKQLQEGWERGELDEVSLLGSTG
jgi:hypothetical protein